MTEPNDRELEQYLESGGALSRRYREASRETAPPELDAAILAQAHAEVRRRKPRASPWLASLALAASVVLAVNLGWNVQRSGPAPAGEPHEAEARSHDEAATPPVAIAPMREPFARDQAPAGAPAPAAKAEADAVRARRASEDAQTDQTARLQERKAMALQRSEPKLMAEFSPGAPRGWSAAGSKPGDYEAGVDKSVGADGDGSYYLWRARPGEDGFGTLMSYTSADAYRGKRIRLSAKVQTQDVTGWAGLWMRVDGSDDQPPKSFDNMQDRPITGDQPWRNYSVVLDVDPSARGVAFGLLLHGAGTAWIDQVRIEEVGADVPVTNRVP